MRRGCAAAQNAEIIQAGTVEIAPGQLLGRDRDRDRPPWIPFNHLPVPTASPPRQQYAGTVNDEVLVDLCDHQAGGTLNNRDCPRNNPAKPN